MTRVKYKQLEDCDYLVTVNNFSTRVHEDLIYAAINLQTFDVLVFEKNIPRSSSGVTNHPPLERDNSSSLADAKKKVKNILIKSGVIFNVEARNKTK